MIIVEKCCCCFNLRIGVKSIAITIIIFSINVCLKFITSILKGNENIYSPYLLLSIISLITSSFLLIGVQKVFINYFVLINTFNNYF